VGGRKGGSEGGREGGKEMGVRDRRRKSRPRGKERVGGNPNNFKKRVVSDRRRMPG